MKKYLTIAIIITSKILFAQIINTYAGTGISGYSGDGGPALNAQFIHVYGIKAYSNDLYLSEWGNHTIRKVNSVGIITTIAGTGVSGFSGDGGPAVNAQLTYGGRPMIDKNDNFYFIDAQNYRVRKIATNGVISTIAGTGVNSFSGDGGLATSAGLHGPAGVDIDSLGNVYISEFSGNRIRKINTSGIITTIAGNGTYGYSGDGGPALNAQFKGLQGISLDRKGNLFVSDMKSERVRIICLSICGVGLEENLSSDSSINLFPNPSNGNFKVETELDNCSIIIYNSLGQKIHEQKLTKGNTEIILRDLNFGLFNYTVLQNEQIIKAGKVTIQ